MTQLNQTTIRELLDYNPETGVFTNKVTRSNRSKKGAVVGAIKYNKASDKSYLVTSLYCKKYYMHRLAFMYMVGKFPDQIDHVNGNGLDNSWKNLRSVCNQDNQRNRVRAKNNTSGVTGVGWDKSRKLWTATIQVSGRNISLGRFKLFDGAVEARKNGETTYKFHSNHDRDNNNG